MYVCMYACMYVIRTVCIYVMHERIHLISRIIRFIEIVFYVLWYEIIEFIIVLIPLHTYMA